MTKRQRLATYTPETLEVKCIVCRSKATCEVLGVEVGPFGGHWMRLPAGWWVAIGTTIAELRDNRKMGAVRCPKCFARTQEIARESEKR